LEDTFVAVLLAGGRLGPDEGDLKNLSETGSYSYPRIAGGILLELGGGRIQVVLMVIIR
jgi:hypothetical protein